MDHDSFIRKHIDTYDLPYFGYKIHLSALWENYQDIIDFVVPLLDERKIAYKYLKNSQEIWTNFSVDESLAESGKLFTIYPKNQDHFQELLEWLYQELPKEWEGIYIMSDRPYRDSKIIFYRFGTISFDITQTKNGIPTLIGPSGEEWQDYQKNYFDLPSWMTDIQEDDTITESYLGSHYNVQEALKTSNGGNIYRAIRLSDNKGVILKESRPHILYINSLKKSELRRQEFQLSKMLDRFVPKPIEEAEEWINTYYIYEEINGQTFYEYATELTIFSYTTDNRRQNLEKYYKFLDSVGKLLAMVDFFHKKDLIIHDIHPNNIMVDANGDIYLVDLEHTYTYGTKPVSGVYHDVALKGWNNVDGKVADCHKVANMILYCLGRLQIKEHSQEHISTNLNLSKQLLLHYGISTALDELLEYLFSASANIEKAKLIYQSLKQTTAFSHTQFELDFNALSKVSPFSPVTLINRIKTINQNFGKYQEVKDNELLFRYQVDSEMQFGLSGLLGSVILLKEQLSSEMITYALEKIISQLVDLPSGKGLSIGNNRVSPYFNNGSAGLIQGLLLLDQTAYLPLIRDIASSLDFEFAQRPGYDDGMLGIAETLLQLVDLDLPCRETLLKTAERLLLNVSFYVAKGLVPTSDFKPVLIHLENCYHERNLQK